MVFVGNSSVLAIMFAAVYAHPGNLDAALHLMEREAAYRRQSEPGIAAMIRELVREVRGMIEVPA